jgi:plasmid maintenance system antidote protein VapI
MSRPPKPILNKLNALIAAKGNKQKAAASLYITPQYFNDILNGRRDISENIAKRLGFRWKLEPIE